MTNLSPVVPMNISNETRILSFSRIDEDDEAGPDDNDDEELSCGSTMLAASSPCNKIYQLISPVWVVKDQGLDVDLEHGSQLHGSSTTVLDFMTPRRKRSCRSRLATFEGRSSSKELWISDLYRSLPRSPTRQGQTQEDSLVELFSRSTGTIDEGPSSYFPKAANVKNSRAFSAGANDITSWTQTRRRRRKGKCLQHISSSVRSLPRELELRMDEEEGARDDDNHFSQYAAPTSGGDVNTSSTETERRVQSIIDDFAGEYLPPLPLDL